MMNGHGKSDRPVVPAKSPNKAGQPAAEGMEGRGLAKGNLRQQNACRTPSRTDAPSALERVRQAAGKDKQLKFTALMHHIYNLETLKKAYFGLKREACAGVDGETWRHYGEIWRQPRRSLGEAEARSVPGEAGRRVYIPKADGERPLGVTGLEDKIVQRAAVEVMNAIYESDFLGFSYGFRPGRSQHQALDALYTGLLTKKVNWVLDVDIEGFSVRQDKPGAFSGCNSRPGKGKATHRESSLGLMEVTTWVKRRQSDVRAVTQVKRLSLVNSHPGADRVEDLEGNSRRSATARVAGDSGGV